MPATRTTVSRRRNSPCSTLGAPTWAVNRTPSSAFACLKSRTTSAGLLPRCERVLVALERRCHLGMVADDDVAHGVPVDPVQSFGGVDLRGVVAGEEPVALQAAAGHQDEDPERGVTEPEARRRLLAEQPDLQVDVVDPAVVELLDLVVPDGVRGELVERLDPRHPQLLAEVVVAANASLAV